MMHPTSSTFYLCDNLTDAILAALACEHGAALDDINRLEKADAESTFEYRQAVEADRALMHALAAIPARTPAGVKSKVHALSRSVGRIELTAGAFDGGLAEHEASLAASILRDLIALA